MKTNIAAYVLRVLLVALLFLTCTTVLAAPSAPTGVSASDGTYSNRVFVSWDVNPTNWLYYQVFRSTSNYSGSATKIADWLTTNAYSDTSVTPGVSYWYWLKAFEASGTNGAEYSDFSNPDSGYATASTEPDPPTGVSATDGTYDYQVAVSWNMVSNAAGYQVFRSTSNYSGSASLIADWIGTTSYNDTSTVSGVTYWYWVKAYEFGGGTNTEYSDFSTSDSGYASEPSTPPDPPTGVSATDGTYSDRVFVSWNVNPTNWLYYQVFRSTSNYSGSATKIADWLTTNAYSDTSVTPGVSYWYWLKAFEASGTNGSEYSDFSNPDSGYATASTEPDPPTGVSATDGTYDYQVAVSWNMVSNAAGYQVYRSTSNYSGSASLIADWIGTTSYNDTSTVSGITYWYWVKAYEFGGGTNTEYSDFSTSDSGYASEPSTPPDPPTGVSATDGTYSDRVFVSWDVNPTNWLYYQVYRSVSNYSGSATKIADWLTTNAYSDTSVTPGVTYWYWLKAFEASGTNSAEYSDFSSSDSGYATASTEPDPPTGVSATDGTYDYQVAVSWNTATNVDGYQLFRSTSNYSGSASMIANWLGSPYYNDTSVVSGVTYWYWAKTFTGFTNMETSDFSDPDSGYASIPSTEPDPPTGVSATDGTYDYQVAVSWNMVSNAAGYQVYRSTSNYSGSASLIADWIGTTSYNDTSTVSGITYWYWVKAYEFGGGTNTEYSDFSTSDSGYASEPSTPPDPPTGVSASDGTYSDRVFVSWDVNPTNWLYYQVFRSVSNYSGSATKIADWLTTNAYSDTSVTPGVSYWYWLKAFEASGTNGAEYSDFSNPDSGYANQAPTAILTADPTNGICPLRVVLSYEDSFDDDSIVLYEIDKDGDGVYDISASSPGQVVVFYGSPDSYTPRLRVTDSHGAQDTDAVTIVLWGESPEANLQASVSNGTAPLAVTLDASGSTVPSNRYIAIYEWDVNGDGVFDGISSNAQYYCTYRQAGTYYPVVRITDDMGVTDDDSTTIAVTAPLDPPEVTLQASVTNGTIPLDVTFTANVVGGSNIIEYAWDVDGDNETDFTTASNTLAYSYTAADEYLPAVTVIDAAGLSGFDSTPVTAAYPVTLRVWISVPKDGATVWGETVSLRANTAPGNLTQSVQFQYRQGISNWINLGSTIYAPAHSFATNWNVTGLIDGTDYELRAAAMDVASNMVYSEAITVTVSSSGTTNAGYVSEGLVDGKQQKEQRFDPADKTEVDIADGTRVIVPANTVGSDATVKVILTGTNSNAPNGSAAGKGSIEANRQIEIEGDPALAKAITMIIPYPDEDDDGIVDDTGIPETSLTVHWFDTTANQWRRALMFEIFPVENYVKASTYHLTEFGLFGSRNLLSPTLGSALVRYTSEISETNSIANLTDDNTLSYWQSGDNPTGAQEMVYTFANQMSALVSGAGIYNHGSGSEGYSENFTLYGSINGSDYTVLTSGVLAAGTDLQFFDLGTVTCRQVRLVVSSGVSTTAWELAEFELYGALTDDADGDTLQDQWEVAYFGDLHSNSATNDPDDDGLDNGGELDLNGDPNLKDTDGDNMDDAAEAIAGTALDDASDFFQVQHIDTDFTDWVLTWRSATGRLYTVLGSDRLPVTPLPLHAASGTGQTMSYTNNMTNTANFMWLQVEEE